ncbi:MAG: GTP-binding protein [Gemmataceae bacterium]|nr:GTP-binding protein [Gemmataceae bacterium]
MLPVNLITGFLGVGKTTAVIDLLHRRPPGERWAVLVNEAGAVGIDAALIEGQGPAGVAVREVAGGCVCCATAPYLGVALHFLLVDERPDRLLIEPSGLGHPAGLVDALRANYAGRLEVRATVGLVDPPDFADPAMHQNPVFADQVALADVLVLNKLDAAAPELVEAFRRWADGLDPPKLLVAGTTGGRLDPAWLDLPAAVMEGPDRFGFRASDSLLSSKGWTFPPAVVFDPNRLLPLLRDFPGVVRLKGVFRTPAGWLAVNRAGRHTTAAPTADRRDSRAEAFAAAADWDRLGRELAACGTAAGPG